MKPTGQLQRFLPHSLACVACLAVVIPGPLSAAPTLRELLVPAAEAPLPISVEVPESSSLGESNHWQLREAGEGGLSTSAEIFPTHDERGAPAAGKRQLVATIPARKDAGATRRFQLEPANSPEPNAGSAFRFAEVNSNSLGLWQGERPVFVYNYGIMSKPGVPADRDRSTYIHPIYGLDGEVLTDDFPQDHYHHRGLFWAWPHVRIEGVNYDLWDIRGIHQRFERWLERRTGPGAAVLGVENGWFIGTRKVMQERVWLTVFPAASDGQVLDVDLTWIPVDRPITLAGAEEKSYGGFTLRFAPRTNTVITTTLGSKPEDLTVTRLPWADLSAQFAGNARSSGAAIFISPEHPDYPPTWLTRHYGALCVGWPGVTPATFKPGEQIHCKYRVWIHRGAPAQEELAAAYRRYELLRAVRWAGD